MWSKDKSIFTSIYILLFCIHSIPYFFPLKFENNLYLTNSNIHQTTYTWSDSKQIHQITVESVILVHRFEARGLIPTNRRDLALSSIRSTSCWNFHSHTKRLFSHPGGSFCSAVARYHAECLSPSLCIYAVL